MPDDVLERTAPEPDDRGARAAVVAGASGAGAGAPGACAGLGERLDALPPGAGLLAELEALDLGALASYDLPEVVVQARRVAARAHALERFGLRRFLSDWDHVLERVTR
jgi:hypothetical protein